MKAPAKMLAVLLCLCMAAVSLVACATPAPASTGQASSANPSQSSAPTEPFKIANIGPLTGDSSQYGLSMKAAIEVAVTQWNADGGVNGQLCEILNYDDKNDAKESVSLVNLAIEDDVLAVLGPFSSTCAFAVAPLLMKAEIIHIAVTSSHPDTTKIGEWIFRGCPLNSTEVYMMAEAAYNDLGARTAAVIYVNNDFGKSLVDFFVERFIQLGGTVDEVQNFVDGQTKDFSPMLSRMIASNPDVLYLGSFYNDTASMILQLENLNYEGHIIASGTTVNAAFTPLVEGGRADGVLSTIMYSMDNPNPKFQEFVALYTEETGREIDFVCLLAYDSADALLHCVSQAGEPDRVKVRDALANLKDFEGCNGTWSYDENRDQQRDFLKIVMRNDEWILWDDHPDNV